jgi:hypothetical protein
MTLRGNNYLNVKNNRNDPWLDAGEASSKTDDRGHAIFKDPAWGVRAAILTLRTYYFKHGKRTILSIINRWAPASDTIGSLAGGQPNQPNTYAATVAKWMGISATETLEIFQPNKTLGNLAQLFDLVAAMAKYEHGHDTKLSKTHFKQGLELVQEGVTEVGVETVLTNETAPEAKEITEVSKDYAIKDAVGKWNGATKNDPKDVSAIQLLLMHASHILSNGKIDPGVIDGKISKTAGKSQTQKAIFEFQRRYMVNPDGVVSPAGRTWRELNAVIQKGNLVEQHESEHPEFFPLRNVPKKSWKTGPGAFGQKLTTANSINPGCSLYCSIKTDVFCITSGYVLKGNYYFYAGTYAVDIDHGGYIVRYGGLSKKAFVETGDYVNAGQVIGEVGDMKNVTASQLHIELFDKSAEGPLNVGVQASALDANGIAFHRRKDLQDPTGLLDRLKGNVVSTATSEAKVTRSSNGATKTGFCIVLDRIKEQKRSGKGYSRTLGEYQCYWNGQKIEGLGQQMLERGGPGSNDASPGRSQRRRIEEGVYPLRIHVGGKYATYHEGTSRKAAILVGKTEDRTAILIHQGYNYLSSIGCLNPTSGITSADTDMNWKKSRLFVLAIIAGMKEHYGSRFPKQGTIPDCHLIIRGEPKR